MPATSVRVLWVLALSLAVACGSTTHDSNRDCPSAEVVLDGGGADIPEDTYVDGDVCAAVCPAEMTSCTRTGDRVRCTAPCF